MSRTKSLEPKEYEANQLAFSIFTWQLPHNLQLLTRNSFQLIVFSWHPETPRAKCQMRIAALLHQESLPLHRTVIEENSLTHLK